MRLKGDRNGRAENDGSILNNLKYALKKSTLFKAAEPTVVVNDKRKNFQRFEVYLELNEPIKK